MGQFSLTHLLLISIIFLIFFGPSRLPQLGHSLGRAIRGFKEGLKGDDEPTQDQTPRSVGSNIHEQLSQKPQSTSMRDQKQKDPRAQD